MSYRTYYSLSMEPGDLELQAKIWQEERKHEDSGFSYALDDQGNCADSCKWYDWERDMRRISAKYPDTFFHLHGEGEESGDIWDATFKGGKAHTRHAFIQIEPFDPAKLE